MAKQTYSVLYLATHSPSAGAAVHVGDTSDEAHKALEVLVREVGSTHSIRVVRDASSTQLFTEPAGGYLEFLRRLQAL